MAEIVIRQLEPFMKFEKLSYIYFADDEIRSLHLGLLDRLPTIVASQEHHYSLNLSAESFEQLMTAAAYVVDNSADAKKTCTQVLLGVAAGAESTD